MKRVQKSDKLLNFKDYLPYSPKKIFIETGTCFGRSILLALDAGFEFALSVEAKDDLYETCVETFKSYENVQLFHGKSTDELPIMLENIKSPCVFWLDAHPSGELSAGHADYVEKGLESEFHQHNILKKELEIVLANRKDHVIIIDDQNGENPENKEYVEIMSKANPDYAFFWLDEQMGEMFYKDKILLAVPYIL
jgi:hypothetical protein